VEVSDVITNSLGNGRAVPVDVFTQAQDSTVNRQVVFPLTPTRVLGFWEALELRSRCLFIFPLDEANV